MEIRLLHGAAIAPFLAELGQLRLQVLRDYPFLYDGTGEGEAGYIAGHTRSERSLLVLAQAHGQVVGASLGLPLADTTDALKEPFVARGQDPARVFYFAQSWVLPAYRGQGLGVRFFIERESYAHKLADFDVCAFCSVERPGAHPLRPADFKPLDGFWRNRGFLRDPSLRSSCVWRDRDQHQASEKIMSFWLKALLR
nr:GNAT family acetyltransferase [uncultured Pseudomonas sp.]